MSKLRVSEIYLSSQGEGPNVGSPTVFVRFAGCNLKCPGWPCDTPHAIFPNLFQRNQRLMTPFEVAEEVMKVGYAGVNVCFTGGEPFLQNNDLLEELCELLAVQDIRRLECFSNGTLKYPEWVYDHIYFVLDWKLPGSGEELSEHVQNVRWENVCELDSSDAIKFTVASLEDFEAAVEAYEKIKATFEVPLDMPQVFCGVVWNKMSNADLVGMMFGGRQLTWRLNVQVHNYIWDREQRGI